MGAVQSRMSHLPAAALSWELDCHSQPQQATLVESQGQPCRTQQQPQRTSGATSSAGSGWSGRLSIESK